MQRQRKTKDWERLEISLRKLEILGYISFKDGQNKGQKLMDLREAEEIKRWQEYTEELYKKDLHEPDTTMVRSPWARHPEMWSQVGLRKHHYKQS